MRNRTRPLAALLAFAFSWGQASAGEPQRSTGNVFHSSQAILDQIQGALSRGERRVRITPGVYYSRTAPKKIHLTLRRLDNFEIDATGVNLVCSNLVAALEIVHCKNLTLRGLSIDYDPLPMTQGAIVAFGPSREWTELRIHDGYPAPTAISNGWGFLWTSDRATRTLKPGASIRNNRFAEDRGQGVWRIHHGRGIQDTAESGDLMRVPQAIESASALYAHFSTNLALENVTIHSAPYHFACAFQWLHGLTLRGCRVVPGAPPAGAREARIFSSVGDGFNCAGITGPLTIEGCETDATGDDGIPVYTEPILVLAGERTRLTLAFRSGDAPILMPGAKLRFFSRQSGRTEDAMVLQAARSTLSTNSILEVRKAAMNRGGNAFFSAVDVELGAPVTARAGDEARWLDECEAPTIIRGNRIHNAGSRGIVANRSRVLLENNLIDITYLPGIHTFAFFRSEGGCGFQENLVMRGNRISQTCVGWPRNPGWLGAISVVAWDPGDVPFGGHRDVVIESNEIRAAWGAKIQVHGASDLVVRGNRFLEAEPWPPRDSAGRPVDNRSVIFLEQVRQGRVMGNALIPSGDWNRFTPLVEVSNREVDASGAFIPGRL